MKIDSIELINFRQYKKDLIEFPTSENKNLTIIQGANGAGKTNLLNAITWCLYGKEMHTEEKYKGFPLVNMVSLRETPVGRKIDVGVRITMRDEEGMKIIFERGAVFKKMKDDDPSIVEGPVFSMKKQVGKDIKPVKDPEYRLNKLIPESIEEYFFFDGERLNDYFQTASGEKIQKAVFKISQVGLIENAIDHLENKKNDFVRKASELSSEAEDIKEELGRLEDLIEEHKEELGELKEEKGKAEKKEEELRTKLGTSSIADVRALESERKEIESELEELEDEIEEFAQERSDYLIEVAPSIFAYDPLREMKQLISGKEESGDIPPDYKKNFLERLLKKGKCICGTDISKENDSRRKVKVLLHECDEITDISDELIRENANLRSMMDDLKDFDKKRISYGKKLKQLEEDRKRKSENLHKIDEKFERLNVEEIKRWNQQLKNYRNTKEEIIGKIAVLKDRIRDVEEKINKKKKELFDELRKEKKHNRLMKNLSFCEENLKALEKVREEIMEDVRREIEDNTGRQFFDLIWKKETFKKVKIDEGYNISVADKFGMEGIGTLGAGERQVLALSFIAALNSVSGFNVPIIIDTPLARISREPRKNIANNLLNYMRGKQVVLLVTDEEYTPEVRKRLSKRVGKEYIIDFKETKEGGEARTIAYEG